MSPPTPSCSASVPRVGGGAAADARSSGARHGTQPVRPPAAPPPDRWSGVFGGRGEGVVVAARVIGWCTCTWRQQGGNLVHPSPSCKLSHTRTRTHGAAGAWAAVEREERRFPRRGLGGQGQRTAWRGPSKGCLTRTLRRCSTTSQQPAIRR